MTVLPDTSIWVEYLRPGESEASAHLDSLLFDREAVTCGPIVAEILAGARQEHREAVWSSVGSVAWVDLEMTAWRQAGEVAFDLARAGGTVPLTDVVIAVAAVRGGAALWTNDRDFERIRQVLPTLDLYEH